MDNKTITTNINSQILSESNRTWWNWTPWDISDWYHTFDELYKHRIHLFIALCKISLEWDRAEYWYNEYDIIRSKKHYDWLDVWNKWGMFLLVMRNHENWDQISYHIPNEYWDKCDFAHTEEQAKIPWDWHTSDDVLYRLLEIT